MRDLLLAIWAFGEACFWFIAPDFLLLPYAIERPDRWRRSATIAWCASFVGGTFYFVFCSLHLSLAESIITRTPFVLPRMFVTISDWYTSHGSWGALAQSWSFMSFKIWTFEAVRHDLSWWTYFPIVMFSRIFRLFVVTGIAARLAPFVRPWWMRYRILSWTAYSVAFLGMLVFMER